VRRAVRPAAVSRPAKGQTPQTASISPLLRGLPPVVGGEPRVLILGSMPGVASLDAAQYYAHPRNAFWPIIGDCIGFDPALPYAQRLMTLAGAGIALWDVIGACRRPGSLDSDIESASIEPNDIAGLLVRHPGIAAILTNGGTASRLYRRHLAASLPRIITHAGLPSTSPAHAGLPFPAKCAAWHAALRPWLGPKCERGHISDSGR
jgi:hypoxanthine-DNA glycosylase